MDILGSVNLKGNELKNGRFEHLEDFPTNPKVGTWSFIRKQLMLCVEMNELPVWVPLTPERNTYLHEQKTAATEWVIPHKLDQTTVMVQCFDGGNSVVSPESIAYIDSMTTKITFPDAILGTAIVMFGYTEGAHVDGKFKGGASSLPIGATFYMLRSDMIDEDCLPVMGQTVTKEFYPALVEKLTGDPDATEVVLDDARGLFVRNLDFGRGKDSQRTSGTLQEQMMLAHNHDGRVLPRDLGSKRSNKNGNHQHISGASIYPYSSSEFTYPFGYVWQSGKGGGWGRIYSNGSHNPKTSYTGDHDHSVNIGEHDHELAIENEGGIENRPENIAYILVVKAK